VQVSRSLRRAQVFNLGEAELRAQVLEPWLRGGSVALGDRHWDPASSRIVVLEGPALAPPELGHGQGWNNALRTGQDVTRAMFERLEPPRAAAGSLALLAGDAQAREEAEVLLTDLGLSPVDWSDVRERILESRPAGVAIAAAVVVIDGPPGFDVGLALGALGRRAIAVTLTADPPPAELAGIEVLRLDSGRREGLQALVERLQQCGCEVRDR